MEDFELPLARWRVHGTAADLFARAGDTAVAESHCELGRATVMSLANSLEPEDPLRMTFLSAPAVHRVLERAERIGA